MITPMSDEMKAQMEQTTREVSQYLRDYNGNSFFLRSVRDQMLSGKTLTMNQVNAVKNSMVRNLAAEPQVPLTGNAPVKSGFSVGDIITVNRTMAMKFGLMVGYGKPFYNFEIVKVVADQWGRLTATLETCYKKVSNCACCGLQLTDPQSIAVGIGPICRKRTKAMSIEELDKALGRKILNEVAIPHRFIKNHYKTNAAA